MHQEHSDSGPERGAGGKGGSDPLAEVQEGYEPLAEGDASLEALGGTGIELIHKSVTGLSAAM
jgi:hypothetical protein